jgi:hypothetical protein
MVTVAERKPNAQQLVYFGVTVKVLLAAVKVPWKCEAHSTVPPSVMNVSLPHALVPVAVVGYDEAVKLAAEADEVVTAVRTSTAISPTFKAVSL